MRRSVSAANALLSLCRAWTLTPSCCSARYLPACDTEHVESPTHLHRLDTHSLSSLTSGSRCSSTCPLRSVGLFSSPLILSATSWQTGHYRHPFGIVHPYLPKNTNRATKMSTNVPRRQQTAQRISNSLTTVFCNIMCFGLPQGDHHVQRGKYRRARWAA